MTVRFMRDMLVGKFVLVNADHTEYFSGSKEDIPESYLDDVVRCSHIYVNEISGCVYHSISTTRKSIKVMISQPVSGKTASEIWKQRKPVIDRLKSYGYTVLHNAKHDPDKEPLLYLSESMEIMSKCDVVYFMDAWIDDKICRVEYKAALEYEKGIFTSHTELDISKRAK